MFVRSLSCPSCRKYMSEPKCSKVTYFTLKDGAIAAHHVSLKCRSMCFTANCKNIGTATDYITFMPRREIWGREKIVFGIYLSNYCMYRYQTAIKNYYSSERTE